MEILHHYNNYYFRLLLTIFLHTLICGNSFTRYILRNISKVCRKFRGVEWEMENFHYFMAQSWEGLMVLVWKRNKCLELKTSQPFLYSVRPLVKLANLQMVQKAQHLTDRTEGLWISKVRILLGGGWRRYWRPMTSQRCMLSRSPANVFHTLKDTKLGKVQVTEVTPVRRICDYPRHWLLGPLFPHILPFWHILN